MTIKFNQFVEYFSILSIVILLLMYIFSFIQLSEEQQKQIKSIALDRIEKDYSKYKTLYETNELVSIVKQALDKDKQIDSKAQLIDSVFNSEINIHRNSKTTIMPSEDLQERKDEIIPLKLKSLNDREYVSDYLQLKLHKASIDIPKDFRIFLISNIVLFLIMMLINYYYRINSKAGYIPMVILCFSTFIAMYSYLFSTNWLYKIIFESYSSYGYLISVLFLYAVIIFSLQFFTLSKTGNILKE